MQAFVQWYKYAYTVTCRHLYTRMHILLGTDYFLTYVKCLRKMPQYHFHCYQHKSLQHIITIILSNLLLTCTDQVVPSTGYFCVLTHNDLPIYDVQNISIYVCMQVQHWRKFPKKWHCVAIADTFTIVYLSLYTPIFFSVL